MSDTSWSSGMLAGLTGSGLFAPSGTPTSYSAKEMRQKIALAMLMRQRKFPKTFGEGLAAIGEAYGENSMAKALERQAAETAAASETGAAAVLSSPPPSAAAPVPPVATTGPRSDLPASVPPTEDVADASAAAPAAVPPVAVAGFRPPPAYLAPYLAASGLPPERQAYLGHLAGKEAKSANEVSPTGAAGPFQFIRSTGRQYGLLGPDGDRRTDIPSSITAANRLTDDNAAVLEKALGRPPSPGELALAHQQGAGTAAKMLSGSGNAPNYNLAVNNAGGLGPQAAANKIMAYYNMPGSGGGNPRDNAAAILASRTADTPLTPADTAQEQRLSDVTGMTRAPPSFGATASNRTGDVMSDMPPVTGALQGPLGQSVGDTVQQRQQVTQPPPQDVPPPPGPQLAQGGPFPPPPGPDAGGSIPAIIPGGGLPPALPPVAPPPPAPPPPAPPAPSISTAPPDTRTAISTAPEYTVRNRPMPEPPVKPTMGPIEQQMTRDYLIRDIDPRIKAAAQMRIDAERAQLGSAYENQLKNYEIRKQNWLKEQEQETQYQMTRPKQQADVRQSEATTRNTTLEADKRALELGGYPAQLVQERKKREAEVGSAQAEAEMKSEDARIKSRTGQLPSELYPKLDKEKAGIEQTIKAQDAQQLARKAIKDGVITGYGANGIIASAKFADWAFKNGMSGNLAANTEIMSATLKAGLSEAVKTVNGEGGVGVSNADVKIAEGIQGSDPNLQMKTIKTIMDRAAEINHRKIGDYEGRIDRYLSGEKAEDFYKTGGSRVPQEKLQILLTEPTDQRKAQFNDVYGPGAAELELARFKRAQDRGR
jgi:hypothetical protein